MLRATGLRRGLIQQAKRDGICRCIWTATLRIAYHRMVREMARMSHARDQRGR